MPLSVIYSYFYDICEYCTASGRFRDSHSCPSLARLGQPPMFRITCRQIRTASSCRYWSTVTVAVQKIGKSELLSSHRAGHGYAASKCKYKYLTSLIHSNILLGCSGSSQWQVINPEAIINQVLSQQSIYYAFISTIRMILLLFIDLKSPQARGPRGVSVE